MAGQVYEPAGQLERTSLSWKRMLLALAVNGALLVRAAELSGSWAAVVGSVVLALALALWLANARAYHRARSTPAPALLASGRFPALVVALISAVGVADLAAIATYG